jgi:hypothetical protein
MRIEVEVHMVVCDRSPNELNTFYKYNERGNAHLMRLFNNEADHIVLLTNRVEHLAGWL